MPYYIHEKGTDPPHLSGLNSRCRVPPDSYASRAEAFKDCPKGSLVSFVLSRYEQDHWHEREAGRFASGEYLRVPWAEMEYRRPTETLRHHFAHLSLTVPDMIAYTVDEEHGVTDRQTRTKPGRYLEKFWSAVFSPSERAAFVAECSAQFQTLQVTQDPDEIRTIYNSTLTGFSSCMQRKADGPEYHWQTDMDNGHADHPCVVYAGPDLAVAYRGELIAVKQRVVCWPEKKRYSRIYGSGALQALLTQAGYRAGSLEGARIRRIAGASYGTVLVPYLDGIDGVRVDAGRRYLVLDNDGPIEAQETCGSVDVEGTRQSTCDYCSHTYNPGDDDATPEYCAECARESWTCDRCGGRCWGDPIEVEEANWCAPCVRRHATRCEHCRAYHPDERACGCEGAIAEARILDDPRLPFGDSIWWRTTDQPPLMTWALNTLTGIGYYTTPSGRIEHGAETGSADNMDRVGYPRIADPRPRPFHTFRVGERLQVVSNGHFGTKIGPRSIRFDERPGVYTDGLRVCNTVEPDVRYLTALAVVGVPTRATVAELYGGPDVSAAPTGAGGGI